LRVQGKIAQESGKFLLLRRPALSRYTGTVGSEHYIQPIPLVWRREAFDQPDFIFEIKHDGFRAVADRHPEYNQKLRT
jgi:hypothetical protein